MRKPLLALGLAVSTGLGAVPVADALAATPSNSSIKTGTSQTGTIPTTTRTSTTTPSYTAQNTTNSRSSNAVSGAAIVATALKYLGYPYSATGNSPSTGFSCIGFVSFVYRSNGIPLPGDLQNALAYAPQVPFSNLMPGDILYFQNTVWTGLSHAAIYLGGGRFVHAEYYGYGVRVSSFNHDSKDADYWISKYLGANRPWGGVGLGVVGASPVGSGTPPVVAGVNTSPTTAVTKTIVGGPSASVAVPSLNVRSVPSKSGAVQTVVQQGTSVTVIGHRKGWYKVQLADGSVGWVIAAGLGLGTAPSASVSPTVGNPVAPQRPGFSTKAHRSTTVSAKVDGLRVHSGPSVDAPVVNSVSRGQHLKVLSRSNGWVKVQLGDGSVGWVSASYVPAKRKSSSSNASSSTRPMSSTSARSMGSSSATAAMNVRTGPSLNSSVATVLPAGATYTVIGRSHGWIRVRLSNGGSGWVSAGVARNSGTASRAAISYNEYSSHHVKRTTRSSGHGAVLSTGVRVHSAPGTRAPVVSTAESGTRVRVLGHRKGWTLVRLPNGQTGYVLGTYVGG